MYLLVPTQMSDFVVIGVPPYKSIISGALYDSVVYLKTRHNFICIEYFRDNNYINIQSHFNTKIYFIKNDLKKV